MPSGIPGLLARALADLTQGMEALIGLGPSPPQLVAELLHAGARGQRAEPGARRSPGPRSAGRGRSPRRAAAVPRARLVLVK